MWFSIVVLSTTAIAKLISAMGTTRILQHSDPLLSVTYKHLFLGTAFVEGIVVIVLLFSRTNLLRLGLIAWLATNFLLYRVGLWWVNAPEPCGCLGTLTARLSIDPKIADRIMLSLLVVLLVGSYGLLLKEWRQRKFDIVESDPTKGKPETA